ncbi:hypothetical protein LTR36_002526 [Oleoguttula mirabilis]|uniref:BTB domain-containing protein n=1 Tax=Oleoguttula mirabilis TaxID=1507867 RepID=A0AAV9JLS9_9PEZI|nr:hypothetical protein LTR36_002526 [Oleoguttula mirabilis]
MTHQSIVPSAALEFGVKELYATGLFSDLTISCGGSTFKVHKVILHPQSSVFRALLSGKSKEAIEQEGTITLDDDPKVLQVLLHYLYNFTYDDASRGEETEASFAVRVYAVADKYDVDPPRLVAAQKLSDFVIPTDGGREHFLAVVYAIAKYCNPKDTTLWDIIMPRMIAGIDRLADDAKLFALVQAMPVLNKALLKRKSIAPAGARSI